jgi:hypothetical protein
MKKILIPFLAFIFLGLLFNCNGKEHEVKKPDQPEGLAINRNMFGHYVKRGVTRTSDGLDPGYILFYPTNSASSYLINRKGEVVHEWKGNYAIGSAYLNADGSLFQLATDPDFPVFAGGGESGRVQKITWDGKITWDFEYADEDHHAHHDIAVKPNGNILAIAWEARTAEEALQAGRNPELTPKEGIWPTRLVEIAPEGPRGGQIVWQWHIWDHLIQDFDPGKENYGDVAAHPGLLDINIGQPLPPQITPDSMDKLHAAKRVFRNQTAYNRGADIYHVNAINYNEELEQIAISSPRLSEIFILDQSTSTEEAAGHSGGRYGKGGDFLYRWGNPAHYKQGDSTDQRLFGQHDVRWIEKGKPGAGHLTVFNNAVPLIADSLNYSAVIELELPIDENGNYTRMENGRYGPEEPVWRYIAKDTISFYGSFVSGAERLENGNTMINEGPKGRFFEVTPGGEIVWEYWNPYRGDIREPNGDPINPMPMAYMQFRANFIPANHPGLGGRELKPLDPQPEFFKLPPVKKE